MAAAKRLKRNPRELAALLQTELQSQPAIESADVAGPGFVNLQLNDDYLAEILRTEPLCEPWGEHSTVVIDYSSPNLAKQLHVGHLRSTVIGDAMARSFEVAGYNVIRQNHIGDWGTGFGKLLTYINQNPEKSSFKIEDLDGLNVEANQLFATDEEFAQAARDTVIKLQQNDASTYSQWREFMAVSESHMQDMYDALGVSLQPANTRGESAYNDDLPNVIKDLEKSGLLTLSDGAKCVFLDQFKTKTGEILPMLVQKSDGGYLYHTTDLATLRFRQSTHQPDRILYFTDARQNLHFEMLFAVARKAGFVDETTSLEHHAFGKILGKNGKPFSTRDGSNIPLQSLLLEGEQRARAVVNEKGTQLSAEEQASVSNTLAVNAIKYADLSKNRVHDYTFDWDTMLSFDGNTAPYLLYAYTRLNSIFAKGAIDRESCNAEIQLSTPAEHDVAIQLLRFQETLENVILEAKPHLLCAYMYELTVRFMRFYESCPILKEEQAVRDSRLALSSLTASALELGFKSLGIEPLTRM